jgi:hypothetical protein
MPIGVKSELVFDIALVSSSTNTTSLIAALHIWILLPISEIVLIDKCSCTKLSDIIPSYILELNDYKKVRIYRSEVPWSTNMSCSKNIIILEPEENITEYFFYSQNLENIAPVSKLKNNILEELTNYFYDGINVSTSLVKTQLFKEERFVVLKPVFGIGNRIRTLLTTLYFTENNGYNLYVLWEKTAGYDESSFAECFELKKNFNITFIDSSISIEHIHFDVKISRYDEKTLINLEYDNKIYIQSGSYLNNILFTQNNFIIRCEYFKYLVPSNSIECIVNYIMRNIICGEYNVFHIRRGDAITSTYSGHYKISSIYLFAKYINDSDKINVVISDDYNYCSKFLDVLCPNKFIIINRNNFNKHKKEEDFKYAVNMDAVDFFLFREAKKLYSTNFSSFSYVAAHVFNKNSGFIVVKDTNRFCLNNYDKTADFLPYVNSYTNIHGERAFIAKLDSDDTIINDSIIYLEESSNIILDIYNKYYEPFS